MVAQLNQSDIFIFDFPKRNGVFDSIEFYRKNRFDKQLGLQPLDKGFDSIQIRLWYGGSFTGERLIVLSNSNKSWKAEVSKLTTEYNPNFKGDETERANVDFLEGYLVTRKTEKKVPKSGWDKFIRKLFNLNILTLPDEGKVTGIHPGSVTDGWGVIVEIATKKIYRYYGYNNPDYFYRKVEEARNINHILVLVDEEFELEQVGDYIDELPDEDQWKVVAVDSFNKVKTQKIQLQDIKPEENRK